MVWSDANLNINNLIHKLYNTLLEHGRSHLHEARDVRALDIIHTAVLADSVLDALFVDGVHDEVEFLIHLFSAPAQVGGILSHLKTGSSHSAGIDSLARGKINALRLEIMYGFRLAAHIAHLAAAPAAVLHKLLSIFESKLILEGARQCDVTLDAPRLLP